MKKRLIISSLISIILVITLMLGSTYSLFTLSEDTSSLENNVYETGNLLVEVNESGISLSNSTPISEEVAMGVDPYRITVTNKGTVSYSFNLILEDTTSTSVIDYQYIKVKVGKLDNITLNSCDSNIIKKDIIVLPGKGVNIDVRVWLSDDIKNTEINKSFYAKLKVDGVAIYNDNTDIDNSILIADSIVGKYVAYTGNNGCSGNSCNGYNANYVSDTNMGYCDSSSYKFTVNGWRILSQDDNGMKIVSAGAPECVKTYGESKSSSTTSREYISSVSYLTSSSYTYDEDTDTYTLGDTTTTYTYPTDYSSMDGEYTCGNTTDTSCSTIYVISATSTSISLKYVRTSSCTRGTSSTSSSYYGCSVYSHSTGSTAPKYYYGTSYTVTSSGFKLSGTKTTASTLQAGKYTCKSTSSTGTCTTLYYIVGNTYKSNRTYCNSCSSKYSTTNTYYYRADYTSYTLTTLSTQRTKTDVYLFGDSYSFNNDTGKYSINNISSLNISTDISSIAGNKKYTCLSNTDTTCSTMYEITDDSTENTVKYYTYSSSYLSSSELDTHIDKLNTRALKYCNSDYAKGGVCDSTTVWAMNGDDFTSLTGKTLSTCSGTSSEACGKNNDLIDNGGYYWFATRYSSSSNYSFTWHPNIRGVGNAYSRYLYGLRPVLYLDPSVIISGGSGTYEDPYTLTKK